MKMAESGGNGISFRHGYHEEEDVAYGRSTDRKQDGKVWEAETIALKEKFLGLIDYIGANQNEKIAIPETREMVRRALELAFELHGDQEPRQDGPYVNHILRVAIRIVEEYGVRDSEQIIAGLLHDSVEDQSDKLARMRKAGTLPGEEYLLENKMNRDIALDELESLFSSRVRTIVLALSNEDIVEWVPQSEWDFRYAEHVREAIADPDVFPLKLADFVDNALKLGNVTDLARRLRLGETYRPVIKMFLEQLDRVDVSLPEKKREELRTRFQAALFEIAEYASTHPAL